MKKKKIVRFSICIIVINLNNKSDKESNVNEAGRKVKILEKKCAIVFCCEIKEDIRISVF